MIGIVSKAYIETLRYSQLANDYNISLIIANDSGESIVNTALPAIAVCVKGSARGSDGQYIGGLINDDLIIQLAVITNFDNPNVADDDNYQYDQLDLSAKIRDYIASESKNDIFTELGKKYDFSPVYQGIEVEQTRGMRNDFEIKVNVHKIIYTAKFIDKEQLCNSGNSAILEEVDMICANGEVVAGQMKTYNKNFAATWQRK